MITTIANITFFVYLRRKRKAVNPFTCFTTEKIQIKQFIYLLLTNRLMMGIEYNTNEQTRQKEKEFTQSMMKSTLAPSSNTATNENDGIIHTY
jgi:hypothetical protein